MFLGVPQGATLAHVHDRNGHKARRQRFSIGASLNWLGGIPPFYWPHLTAFGGPEVSDYAARDERPGARFARAFRGADGVVGGQPGPATEGGLSVPHRTGSTLIRVLSPVLPRPPAQGVARKDERDKPNHINTLEAITVKIETWGR